MLKVCKVETAHALSVQKVKSFSRSPLINPKIRVNPFNSCILCSKNPLSTERSRSEIQNPKSKHINKKYILSDYCSR